MVIVGEHVYLRPLTKDDATEKYLGWLHDPEATQYLEVRHSPPASLQMLRDYIGSGPGLLFLAIISRSGHIGNIKLGHDGNVGILIGEKGEWGKNYGPEAIRLLTQYAFSKLGLEYLWAGVRVSNGSSRRAFLKAGWAQQESGFTPEMKFAIRRAQ